MKNSIKSSFSGSLHILLLALTASIYLQSCSSDEPLVDSEEDEDASEQLIQDEALAEDIYADMDELSFNAINYSENSRMASSTLMTLECVSRSSELQNSNLSQQVTLNFGDGCVDQNGRERSGTIVINRTIDLDDASFSMSTTFDNFYVNGNKVEGTRSIQYSVNAEQKIMATVSMEGGKISMADGRIISREAVFTKTIDRVNGEISLTGSAEGINRNGVTYTMTTLTPIIYNLNCAREGVFIAVKGEKAFTTAELPSFEVDYGMGDCDWSILLSRPGGEHSLELTWNE